MNIKNSSILFLLSLLTGCVTSTTEIISVDELPESNILLVKNHGTSTCYRVFPGILYKESEDDYYDYYKINLAVIDAHDLCYGMKSIRVSKTENEFCVIGMFDISRRVHGVVYERNYLQIK